MKIAFAALGFLLATSVAALPGPVAAPAPAASQSGDQQLHQPWLWRGHNTPKPPARGVVSGGSIIDKISKRFTNQSTKAANAEMKQRKQKEEKTTDPAPPGVSEPSKPRIRPAKGSFRGRPMEYWYAWIKAALSRRKKETEKAEKLVKRAERKSRLPATMIEEIRRRVRMTNALFWRLLPEAISRQSRQKLGQKGKTPGLPTGLGKREEGLTPSLLPSSISGDVVTVDVVVTRTTAIWQSADVVTVINTKTVPSSAPGSTSGDTAVGFPSQTPEPGPGEPVSTVYVPTNIYATASCKATPSASSSPEPFSSPSHPSHASRHQSPSDYYPPPPPSHITTTVRVASTVTRKKFKTITRGERSRSNCPCKTKDHYHHHHQHHYHHHRHRHPHPHHQHSTAAEHSRSNTTAASPPSTPSRVHYSGYSAAPVATAYESHRTNSTGAYHGKKHPYSRPRLAPSSTTSTETLTPHPAGPTATTAKFRSTSVISSYAYYYA